MGDEILRVQTMRFGEIVVARSACIDLFAGIIGFPNLRRYVLLEYRAPFSWLQALESPDLAFVVVNAAEFGEHYTFPLPTNDRQLDLQADDEIAILNLVSVRPDPSMTTVNLKAPVVVNLRNRKGRQIILDDARFPTRMLLWAERESEGSADSAK